MDTTTRDAVRAFYRLHQTIAAVIADPFHPDALETLQNAANEANAAMKAAGLLGRPQHELLALVRREFPDYNPTGGLNPEKGNNR
ncbi:hypothetical protein [Streptomyces sp. S1D4-20]|uniref:hypothetical protein n=1 Tax=Streptomyces sp. S1D4-20 TaxID=2594462 RepID=UPI001163824C|nr:hypothetical protein [Streptomyces sp. S1D4-20]QDN54054.1 hypothetical protein FNV67_00295 [Streptomyces sp. S1D4-20]